MITTLYPIIGTRDIRACRDADNMLLIWWRDGVKRRIETKARRHQLPFIFRMVK